MPLIPNKLKELRKSKNCTQKEIAEKAGVNERSYRKYEAGEADPTTSVIINLSNYYGVSADYILGRTNQKNFYIQEHVKEAAELLQKTIIICTEQMRAELEDFLSAMPNETTSTTFRAD